jgi:hypothetical protein
LISLSYPPPTAPLVFFPYNHQKSKTYQQLRRPVVATGGLRISGVLLDGGVRFWFPLTYGNVVFVVMSIYSSTPLSVHYLALMSSLGPFWSQYLPSSGADFTYNQRKEAEEEKFVDVFQWLGPKSNGLFLLNQ